ncbi:MAG: AzlD domain-containing protein [Caldiserica bacterium]|nr:AzlD domain-containing protein [Caldisericota bacterium]
MMADSLVVLAVMASITFASRLLPFLLFSRNHPPRWIATVETVLPPLVLWLLVFYSLSSIAWLAAPYGIPALAGVGIVVLVHRWKHNSLLSTFSGTAVYMILTRLLA